jgi:hypothetical protein
VILELSLAAKDVFMLASKSFFVLFPLKDEKRNPLENENNSAKFFNQM